MLHALTAARSTRPVFWQHAARDGRHHPFAAEVRRLMPALTHGRHCVCYSRPDSRDKMGEDFDHAGRLSRSVFDAVGVPREAEVYICGPNRFMADMKETLATLDVTPARIHAEVFNGGESLTPGLVGAAEKRRTWSMCAHHRLSSSAKTNRCDRLPAHWTPNSARTVRAELQRGHVRTVRTTSSRSHFFSRPVSTSLDAPRP